MAKARWIVVAGALLVAAAAFYVLIRGDGEGAATRSPAMDDIDAQSRAAMRDLLRDEGRED
jgi:hypothetical protein